jgi:nucleoside-diphosphate-sugar epimerase
VYFSGGNRAITDVKALVTGFGGLIGSECVRLLCRQGWGRRGRRPRRHRTGVHDLRLQGKQVRDQIHSHDVVQLFLAFFRHPRCGEVFNLGGGRANSLSILETIDVLAGFGLQLRSRYRDEHRTGDHICYISDLSKVHEHFPDWSITYDLEKIFAEMIERRLRQRTGRFRVTGS